VSRRRVVVVLGILSLATPYATAAQTSRRWGLDASIGPSRGGGGIYNERTSVAVDGLASFRLRRPAGYSPIVALSAGYLGIPGGVDAICQPHPDGGCWERFPRLSYHAWLLGAEFLHKRGASARVLLGYVRAKGGPDRSEANGVQARLEIGPLPMESIAPILGLRFTHLTNYRGDVLTIWSSGLGLRFR
jgi:hypothetical protein